MNQTELHDYLTGRVRLQFSIVTLWIEGRFKYSLMEKLHSGAGGKELISLQESGVGGRTGEKVGGKEGGDIHQHK